MGDSSKVPVSLSDLAAEKLLVAARWAKVYGWILCFISGLTLLVFLLSLFALSSFSSFMEGNALVLACFVFFIYFLFFALLFYLNYQLVVFGREIKEGVCSGNDRFMERGLGRLSTYFKIISLLMIGVLILAFLIYPWYLMVGLDGLMTPDAPDFPDETF